MPSVPFAARASMAVALVLCRIAPLPADGPPVTGRYILVDQFGYRPGDEKVAVLVDPVEGFNAADRFEPGTRYEVRRWETGETVFFGAPAAWSGGEVQANSGDRGWWFDFTAVGDTGGFYLYDAERGVGSFRFRIAEDVYAPVLRAAVRMFYYQRLATEKTADCAGVWTDAASFVGPAQDGEARFVNDRANPATARDLRGGWQDAGDYNKYVTFTVNVIHPLLNAYEENPAAFTDDTRIPESGNGLPDLVDELLFELEWLARMQEPDGGVFIKMGNIDYSTASPPSRDRRPRYYGPKCSSSSISAAGVFAHAAWTLRLFPGLSERARDLEARAVSAWNWYRDNPKSDACDDGTIKSGDADQSLENQEQMRAVAAVYLFALTGESAYHDAVKALYRGTRPFRDVSWSMYDPCQGDALLSYAALPDADPAVKAAILTKKRSEAASGSLYPFRTGPDLYRAYIPDDQYHWGSSFPRAGAGNTNMDMVAHALDPARNASYRNRALGILHYFHGVNPLGMVYLTNMAAYGAEHSAMQVWHDWFQYNTAWDKNPAPGYVPGGPNKSYGGTDAQIKRQPAQKAYRDFNDPYPANSWEITEPAIYYQAVFVKLVSKFVPGPRIQPTDTAAAPGSLGVFPNPFMEDVSLSFHLEREARAALRVYDCLGRRVRTLADGLLAAGPHTETWNGRSDSGNRAASGVYVASFEPQGRSPVRKKLVLVR